MSVTNNHSAHFRGLNVSKDGVLVFAAAIIGIMASLIPWPDIAIELSGQPMQDRSVYIEKIQSGNTLLSYFYFDNVLSFFTFEFLWATLLDFVSRSQYLHYETLFQIISAITLSAFAVILVRKINLFALVFLQNPLIIDLIYSQLRLSLALSILMWLVIFRVRRWYLLLLFSAIATMIHTAMIIFIAAHLVASITAPGTFQHAWSMNKRMMLLALFGFSAGILVGPLREVILSAIGDRRSEYPEASSSLLYLSYWIMLFIFLIVDRNRTLKNYESRYAVAILGIIFINLFTGFYSLRFISATLPFLIVATFRVFGRYNFFVSIPFIGYLAFQWFYYIDNLIS